MRLIKWIIVSIAIVVLTVYYTGGYIAGKLVKYGIELIQPELETQGITITEFDYGKINMFSFTSFRIRDVRILLNLEREIYGKKSFSADFTAESVIIRLSSLRSPAIRITLQDFDLYIQPIEDNPEKSFGKFEKAYWSSNTPIELHSIKESGEFIVNKLNTLFRENSIPDPVEFRADALLNLDGHDIRIRTYTERVNGRTFLRFNPDDILSAAENWEDVDISEKEAQILSQYPARTLHIIKITRDAWRISDREKSHRDDFPDDAFKHIYWSYHLTRTFGTEFAKQITDAHETLPNNTPEQRKMDFHNNEIGRNLAAQDLTVEQIRRRVLEDPNIIRSPE